MRLSETPLSLCALLLLGPSSVASFYLPGVAPTNYQTGDRVPLTVNRLTPSQSEQDTQVRSVFAFDYYHHAFHHCEPEGGPKQKSESLGSILFGDRIQTSPLELYMGKNESCKAVCGKQTFQARDSKFVNRRILQNYNVNWNIDGLPAAQKMIDANNDIFYSPGFALGQVHGVETQTPVLNTHYNIYAEFHEAAQGQFRVVGVLVEPASSSESKLLDDGKVQCGDIAHPLILSEKDATDVVWTYSVYWIPSPTSFATRWDKYLHVYDSRIHWVSLTISAMIVVALVGMVSTILLRTLRKDIARYNRLDDLGLDDFGETNLDDTVQEDSGWKLVHGDVFRPPKHPMILSILVGNGAQLFMMTGFTIAFALLGFLSPSNRGSLTTVMVMLYTFFGAVGGYVSARVYKFFHGDAWKQNIAYTPLLVPGTVFSVFFLLNLFVWARQSSGAVPFTTMLALISIWFLISVPLSVGGSWLGFRAPESTPPVRTNQIPRQIPPSTGYLRPLPSMFLVGILPFGAIFLELYFIISSIWFSRIYYMFGFLFLCYGLMIVTSAAVTILMVYFALCAENYHWQWRAFFTSGASAIYVFLAKRLDVVMLEVELEEEGEERSDGSEFEEEAEIEELDGLFEGKLLIVSFVEVLSSASEVESWLTCGGEVELEDEEADVYVDIVLLDGNVNRGVELLRVELDIALLDVKEKADSDVALLDAEKDDDDPALLVLKVLEADLVLVLLKDIAVLEAHAFVFGVYSGPSGG
ncbi:MAG: Dabb-domain-containing protein [Aureobasidium pullulans]|nr:MAG: Dabb-domain-containing protein [Aureobasidium pullulans]